MFVSTGQSQQRSNWLTIGCLFNVLKNPCLCTNRRDHNSWFVILKIVTHTICTCWSHYNFNLTHVEHTLHTKQYMYCTGNVHQQRETSHFGKIINWWLQLSQYLKPHLFQGTECSNKCMIHRELKCGRNFLINDI